MSDLKSYITKIFSKEKETQREYVEDSDKGEEELKYWFKKLKKEDGCLKNDHYEYFYTDFFGLDKSFFNDKILLDIGCGPRGSIEWADNTQIRIGLDPLANEYAKLGTDKQGMTYVAAECENIPFNDNYFDVVCSFNSLDHVNNLEKCIAEIKRVLKVGGLFLLITDVNHKPTKCEPTIIFI